MFTKFVKDSIYAILILFLAFFTNLLVSILFSNLLGSQLFGDYRIAINILQFFSTLALLGSNNSVYKFLPEYITQKNWAKAKGFISHHLRQAFKICSIILLLGFLFFIYLIISAKQSVLLHQFYHPALLMLIFILPWAVLMLSSSIMRSLNNHTLGMLPFFLVPLVVLAIVYIVSLWVNHFRIEHLLIIFGGAIVLVMVFQSTMVYRLLPTQIINSNMLVDKTWLSVSSQFFIANITFIGLELVELIALKILMPNSSPVGIYSAILIIASFVFLVRQAMDFVISPIIGPLFSLNKNDDLVRLCHKCGMFLVLTTLPLGVVFAYFGKPILLLFGPDYPHGIEALYIVLFATVIGSSCSLAIELLMYSNHHKDMVNINLTALMITIALCGILIPAYGLLGAAIAFLISRLYIVCASIVLCQKRLGIKSCYFF